MFRIGSNGFLSKEKAYRWLFSNKDGDEVLFSDARIASRIFDEGEDFDGTVTIGATKTIVKFCHDADTGEVEVRFPHKQLEKVVPLWETVGVGWLVRDGEGRCRFRSPVQDNQCLPP